MAVVVSDASPLICLSATGRFDLLRQLYGEIVVPTAVWQEITRAPALASSAKSHQTAADAQAAGGPQVATANNRPLESLLDPGEAEAITLAGERTPSLLLIGERDGRQTARALGIPLTGTLGVLLRAKSESSSKIAALPMPVGCWQV